MAIRKDPKALISDYSLCCAKSYHNHKCGDKLYEARDIPEKLRRRDNRIPIISRRNYSIIKISFIDKNIPECRSRKAISWAAFVKLHKKVGKIPIICINLEKHE